MAIDLFKSKTKSVTDELSEELTSDLFSVSLEDSIVGSIAGDEIINFVNTLPTLQRDVLLLHSGIGFSSREISEKLNISKVAVRQRLSLARKAVRDFIVSRSEVNE